MRKLLSSYCIMSPETQAYAAATLRLVCGVWEPTNRELRKALDFALKYYDEFKMLPSVDEMTAKIGFKPTKNRFDDEAEVLYELKALERRARLYQLKRELRRIPEIESSDEMLKRLSSIFDRIDLFSEEREQKTLYQE